MKERIFNIPEYEHTGIYAIVNIKKMMVYIGSSYNIKKRAIGHNNSLKSGKHSNKGLQEDYNNGYKLDFIILEKIESEIDKDFLIAKEKMYMLSSIENSFSIYNLIPKTSCKEQSEWIIQHLLWYFTRRYNTRENLINSFMEKYGVAPAYMKNRKEENRN